MEKDFKEAIDKSKKAMESLESKVEDLAEDFSEQSSEIWKDLKSSFSTISSKLDKAASNFDKKDDEATLQAHLGAMEAKENMNEVKDSIEEFTINAMKSAEVGIDRAVLKAHLGKMEAEDFWENEGKGIREEFNNSKESVSKLAEDAIDEIGSFFEKLNKTLSKEKF